jgi:predicted Zn-dependent protease
MRSICISLVPALVVAPEEIRLWLGFHLSSAKQGVVSEDVEPKLNLIHNSHTGSYMQRLDNNLLQTSREIVTHPYPFKAVNDAAINASALPCGVLYIDRGIFDNAPMRRYLPT